MISSIKNYLKNRAAGPVEKPVSEAYDIWSGSYDHQPGNLMLDLDEIIFSGLLDSVSLENKRIADIGCGTGRHWQKLYNKNPAVVMGFDVSAGMLEKLKQKFPTALTRQTDNNLLDTLSTSSVDCIISTLTIAHIDNIDEAIGEWSRVLKKNGDLIITDFHPDILASGGKRSFTHEGKKLSVVNFVHPLTQLTNILRKHGFRILRQTEKIIGESLKHYYEKQNALPVYYRFQNMPVIYGLHLKKSDDTE